MPQGTLTFGWPCAPPSVLAVHSLSKSVPGAAHGGRELFAGLDFELADGEYVAIMGESGVGKSTLLNLIAGLDAPDSGSVTLDGEVLAMTGADQSPRRGAGPHFFASKDDQVTLVRRARIGFVFQAFHILPYLSVGWNVALPLVLLGHRESDAQARSRTMLAEVGMGDRVHSMPRELSGGELQRVAIARALVHRPRLVLADEPTGNLDPDTAGQIAELLRSTIKASNAMGILVTHSRAAAATTDRALLLTPQGLSRLPSTG